MLYHSPPGAGNTTKEQYKPATTPLRRQTILYFVILVLVCLMALSGVFFAYYQYRAKHRLEELARKEEAFLSILKHVLIHTVDTKDSHVIASLVSGFPRLLQSKIIILAENSSWIYPPAGMAERIPNVKEQENHRFGTVFPAAWKKISSQKAGQFVDERGLYVFTTLQPRSAQNELFLDSAVSEKSPYQAHGTTQNVWKLVSFAPQGLLAAEQSRLRLELVVCTVALLAIMLVPLWLIASAIVTRKHVQAKLWWIANYDTLTGLYNRSMFTEKLEYSFYQAERYNHQFALLMVNLDNFRVVNESLGHTAGDLLLQEAATRLVESVRRSDIVARVGGDEFAVVLPTVTALEVVEDVASRIQQTLSLPFSLQGTDKLVSASIGIALYPEDGSDTDAIRKNAERALYHSKKHGGNSYTLFRRLWRMTWE